MAIGTLLLAVDNSEFARKAITLVGALGPGCRELKVIIMHVIEPIPTLIGSPMREQLREEMRAEAYKVMTPFKEALDTMNIRNVMRVEQGDVAEQLLQVAEKEDVEMIVMGARGQSSLEEMFLGSVSQKVLQHASMPVMISR